MTFREKPINKLYAFALAALFALTLAGCGGGGGGTAAAPEPEPTPMPTAYEVAVDAIAAAETEAAARAAVATAVAAGISGTELQSLNMAVDERVAMLAAAAARRAELVAAAMCDAATAECIALHDALIAALQGDVDRLADDETATNAQQNAAQMALEDAQEARNALSTAMAEMDRSTATGMAVATAMELAAGLEDDRSPDAIQAAKNAIEAAREAVGDSEAYNERIATAQMGVDRAEERNAVDAEVTAATNAASGLTEDSDAAAVTSAQAAIDAAKMAVEDAEHLTDEEKATHNATITSDERLVTLAKNRNDAAEEEAEKQRLAMEEEEQRKANEAMAATAAKLYAGITPQVGTAGTLAADDRWAQYNTAATAIEVSVAGDTALTEAIVLSEDKDAPVADNHGWAGKRYADPAGGDSYEAYVYSNVEAPKQGKKFGGAAANDEFEYALTEGALPSASFVAARVAFTGVTRTAGTETFNLPDPNPGGADIIVIPGSYHGVSGTYSCTPATPADGCSAAVAAKGFTVSSGDTWTFKPGDANARVMDAADTSYASYGWWLRKAENDGPFNASAFHDFKGTAGTVDITDLVAGTATYMGGAAGKYALSSSTATGGINDAGHFTARATLEADFEDDMITGTIDNFMGADGQSRNWSVELKKSGFGTGGIILGADGTGTAMKTVWTIGDDAAAESGQWSGNLREEGTDDVPKVATGTFYTEYGTAGRMVGGFGANKQ